VVVNKIQPMAAALPIIEDALSRYTIWHRGGLHLPQTVVARRGRERAVAKHGRRRS
jgi:hypothetical protein